MIDTHSHINFEEYKKDFDFVLNEIRENDVSKVIIPGVSAETFEEINSYCTKYEMLYGAVGVHPSEVKTYNDNTEKQIIKYLNFIFSKELSTIWLNKLEIINEKTINKLAPNIIKIITINFPNDLKARDNLNL